MVKTWNCIKRFLYRLINNLSRKNVTNAPNLITKSEASSPEVIVVDKLLTDPSINYRLTGETRPGLTVETRSSLTPEKRIPRI